MTSEVRQMLQGMANEDYRKRVEKRKKEEAELQKEVEKAKKKREKDANTGSKQH